VEAPLQFVVGKGGVGKSTLTAALALESASRGLRTLVVEFGGHGGLSRLFGLEPGQPGVPRVVAPRVTLVSLEGDEALAEYLRLVVPIKRLLQLVFSSRLYSVFVAGAPGLKELMTVGKIWYEADRRMGKNGQGQPVWERIFVDAGASGHSLQYLQMPSAAAATFKSGLVHREAVRVQSLLSDPRRTCVHVVATPEDMPVTEACGIVARLRDELHLPLGTLFVNRCRPAPPRNVEGALERLRNVALRDEAVPSGDAEDLRGLLREAAESALGWHEVQEAAIARMEASTGSAVVRLPLLVREEFALAEAGELSALLAGLRANRPAGDGGGA
jgi:anion-transporting  ArsA/GET3 family ATPase